MNADQLKLLWYQALAEPMGLLLSVENPEKVKAALYRARAAAGDPDLAQVQIRVSPVEGGNLLLIRETVSVPATTSPPESLDQL